MDDEQEECIFDDFFLRRLTGSQADLVTKKSQWPSEFLTYEDVLAIGIRLSKPCRFFEVLAQSLVYTVEDLMNERSNITPAEVGYLVGVSEQDAGYLMSLPFPAPDALDWEPWYERVRASSLSR